MTLLKIYKLEDVNDANAICTLAEGEHVVGRGPTLNITDKRVSRSHAQLIVRDHGACIKSVHINPCFFKASAGRNIQILKKDEMIEMKDGDTFSLLADQCWYRVRLIFDEAVSSSIATSSKRCNGDTSPETKKKKMKIEDNKTWNVSPTSVPPVLSHIVQAPVLTDTTDDAPLLPDLCEFLNEEYIADMVEAPTTGLTKDTSDSPSTSGLNKSRVGDTDGDKTKDETELPSTSDLNKSIVSDKADDTTKDFNEVSPPASPSHLAELADDESKEVKELSLLDETSVNSAVTRWEQDETANVEDVEEQASKIKEEPDAKAKEENKAETEVKMEEVPDGSGTGPGGDQNVGAGYTNTNPSTSHRERCWYGASCYRKNPQHRTDFSHPGDNDYDSNLNDDRPDCPFGAGCYRTNKDHRMQYKHPCRPAAKPKPTTQALDNASGDETGEDSASSDSNAGGTNRKRRKVTKEKPKYVDTPEDDYDFDDPFINDASSDDFELSDGDDEETTEDESQTVDDEDTEDKKRLLRDAKKFLKQNRQKKNKK